MPDTWSLRHKSRYGLDEYGRFYENASGQRLMIEPYPFGGWTPQRLLARAVQRWWVLKWHAAVLLTGRSGLRRL